MSKTSIKGRVERCSLFLEINAGTASHVALAEIAWRKTLANISNSVEISSVGDHWRSAFEAPGPGAGAALRCQILRKIRP